MKRLIALTLLLTGVWSAHAQIGSSAIRQNAGFRQRNVPRNDDGSSSLQPLGFTINFFGQIRSSAFVNNNGNITFDSALSTFTPFGLENTRREIIAPFFADVDTRPAGSQLVTYGNDTVNGRNAFGVNWIDVGYFSQKTDKLNSFQLVLIERSDTGPGNVDIEFNYAKVRWETGDASGGVNGFGGVPVTVGWSNGTGAPGTSFELEGSMVSGAFLDNGFRSLVRNRLNSTIPGRYLFRARNGQILQPLGISSSCPMPPATVGSAYRAAASFSGEGSNPRWAIVLDEGASLPAGLSFANGVLSGTPTAAGSADFTLRLTAATEDGDQTVSKRCSVTSVLPRLNITSSCPLPQATVGQSYSRLLQAAGGRGPFTWTLLEGDSLPSGLSLSRDGGIAGIPTAEGNYTFGLSVTSDSGLPATKFCSITVAPARLELTSAGCSLPPATLGVPYTQALEVRGGTAPYSWTAADSLPAGLSLTQQGRIVGIPTELADVQFGAIARDAAGRTIQQNCALTVSAPSINISTACPLPPGVTGVEYSQRLDASGGTAPYTWSQSGTLPAGLRLSSDGRITGRPMAGGPSSFRLLVSDAEGRQTAKACSIPVVRSPFALTSCPVTNVTTGVSFTRNLSAVGGVAPYIFLAEGALPSGVTMNSFGTLSGTVPRPGTFPFDVRVIDSEGRSTVQPCALTVEPSAISLGDSCPLPDGRVGENYSKPLNVTGGVGPYRFELLGQLPSGLTLSSAGVVSGVPASSGAAQFGVRVTDADNRSLSLPCGVQIERPNLPTLRISDVSAEYAPASPGPRVTISLSRPYTLPVRGVLELTVIPETGERDGQVDRPDPRVRFSNGQLLFPLTIAPGQTSVSTNVITTGTVASRMVLTLNDLRIGSTSVPNTAAPRLFRVVRSVPVVTDACYAVAEGGVNVRVTGYSTTRSVNQATLSYATALTPQTVVTTDVTGSSVEFFASDESLRNGGAFTLVLPFTTSAAPTSASIVLSNTVGAAASKNVTRCP